MKAQGLPNDLRMEPKSDQKLYYFLDNYLKPLLKDLGFKIGQISVAFLTISGENMKCANMWILATRAGEKLIFKVQGTKFKRKIGPGASLESFTFQGNIFEGF